MKKNTIFFATLLSIFAFNSEAQQFNFTSPGAGTWTVPNGVDMITVYCWGAGGAGGNAKNLGASWTFNATAGSGGSGGFNKIVNYAVVPGQTISYQIGAGGQYDPNYQSTNPGGGAGGGSSVSTNGNNIVSATGGSGGGKVIVNGQTVINGTGGSPSGVNGSSTAGGTSIYNATAPYILGAAPQNGGGSIANGVGGNNGTVTTTSGAVNGNNGNNRGGGGGGGSVKENSPTPVLAARGGNGGNGAVVICARKLALNQSNLNWNCIQVNTICPVKLVQLNGNYLISSIVVTPPIGYIVSNTSNFSTFGTNTTPLTITVSGNLQYDIATVLYVKLESTANVGQFNGNLSVSCTGTPGVTTKTVSLSSVVSQIPSSTLTTSGLTTFCQGDSVNILATNSANLTYQWINNGINIAGETTNNLWVNNTGNYSVAITDNLGCTVTSTNVSILVNSLPNVTINSNESTFYCSGEQIQNTLTSTQAQLYLWNTGDTTQSISVFQQGEYSVLITDVNGCQNTDSIQITVNPLPNVFAGNDQTTCQGQSVTLNGSGANTYSWNNSVTNNIAFTPSSTNTYVVVGTDANGCQGSDTVLVTVNQNTSSTITQTANNSFTLNGQNYTQSGTYTQVIPNANGCDSTITLNLTINNSSLDEVINSTISIYPNPASNQITIAYAGQIQKVEIMDAKGAKVYSSNENKKDIVLPSTMQTGYYTVFVHTQEGIFRKELVVNK